MNEKSKSQRILRTVIIAIALVYFSASAHAIPITQDKPSQMSEQDDGVQKIQETLERLTTESDRLQKTLSTSASKLGMQEKTTADSLSDPFNKLRETSASSDQRPLDYRNNASQIYRQIQLIKEIMRTPEQSSPMHESPISELDNGTASSMDSQKPASVQDTSALFGDGKSRLPVQLPTTTNKPDNITSVSLNPVRILPEAIDLFEMGNSLFATTEVPAALKAYASVDATNLTAIDSIWLEYFTACCNRTMSDLDTAESIYRQVSNENAHGELVSLSRWWLNQLGRKKMATETYGEFESEFELLMERVKDYAPGRSK